VKFFNIIKDISQNSIANIILKGERLNTFPVRSGTRQGLMLFPLKFNIIFEVLDSPIRQENKIRGRQVGK